MKTSKKSSQDFISKFNGLCAVGFVARASYGLARTPVLALFVAYFAPDLKVLALLSLFQQSPVSFSKCRQTCH